MNTSNTQGIPKATQAEAAVLEAILLNPMEYLPLVADILQAQHFYSERNKLIYEQMLAMDAASIPIDPIGLNQRLKGRISAEDIGKLTEVIPAFHATESHARMVRDAWVLRELIGHGRDLIHGCQVSGAQAGNEIVKAEAFIYGLAEGQMGGRFESVGVTASANLAGLESCRMAGGQSLKGLSTGFRKLDGMTAGLRAAEYCVIGARPSQGKTSLALSMGLNMAKLGHRVGLLSMEMSRDQIALRLQSMVSGVPLADLRGCTITTGCWSRLAEATTLLQDLPLWIDDTSRLDPTTMRSKCRRLKREKGLDIVLVDYIQLMNEPDMKKRNRDEEMRVISASMKGLAKDLDIAVVALAQLNRDVEKRGDKRPIMSDLRESGNLEQDADIVLFINRPEQYLMDKTPVEQQGMAEIIVAKQRNGPVGSFWLCFVKDTSSFSNPYHEEKT